MISIFIHSHLFSLSLHLSCTFDRMSLYVCSISASVHIYVVKMCAIIFLQHYIKSNLYFIHIFVAGNTVLYFNVS